MPDIFISYSFPDTNEAKQIAEKARKLGLSVFFSGDTLRAGEKWEEKVVGELMQSWKVFVLFTPNSKDREWVISEWSIALYHGIDIIPVLKDVVAEAIPSRLQRFQCWSYYKVEDELIKLENEKESKAIYIKEKEYLDELKKLATTLPTIYCPQTNISPWTFKKCVKTAQDEVFICGQNLHVPLVGDDEDSRKILFEFLQGGKAAKFLMCDFDYKDCVDIWAWVTEPRYFEHLKKATENLQKWLKAAEREKLRLEAKVVPFVPVSMTFIDCGNNVSSPYAKLIVTPNAYKPDPGNRPAIFFHRANDESVIKYYYLSYNERYKYGRNIINVTFSHNKSLQRMA